MTVEELRNKLNNAPGDAEVEFTLSADPVYAPFEIYEMWSAREDNKYHITLVEEAK